jgi:hypothetical protein
MLITDVNPHDFRISAFSFPLSALRISAFQPFSVSTLTTDNSQ